MNYNLFILYVIYSKEYLYKNDYIPFSPLVAGRVQRVKAQIDLAQECSSRFDHRIEREGVWSLLRRGPTRSISRRNDGMKRDVRKKKNGECDLIREKRKERK